MADEELIVKKIVIIGDGACGKTSLMTVYKDGVFPEKYIPTIFENTTKSVEFDGKMMELRLWDTAGQEDYERLRLLAYKDTHVVLMSFSLLDPDSFANIKNAWYPEYQEHLKDAQIVLVGTKYDLKNDSGALAELEKQGKVPVTQAEGEEMAKSINAFCYRECSAKTSFGVKEVFDEAIKASFLTQTSSPSLCPLCPCCNMM
eukprot:GFUD01017294.1.p1 GENE.GFUD01017294.1~~GFUD01017294.1.p1  ORF type:complete len:202 (-),score=48.98 GFUD01017294.1:62-667(-)